jgi:predicted MFS family arabinose efflux permease
MVATLLLVRFFDELAAFLPAGALESFRDDLDLTYAEAGAVLTAIGPGALAGNLAAIAADFTSRRLIVVGGALAYSASMLLFAVGDAFVSLLAAGFVVGAASTAMVDAGEIALTDVGGDRLRRLLARGNLLAYAGDVVGPLLLIGVAAAGMSWRAAFAIAGSLLAAYALVLAVQPIPRAARGDDDPSPRGHVAAVLRDRRVWVLGALSVLINPLDETIVGFGIAFLEEERGLTAAVATSAALLATAGGVLGLLLAPRLERHDDDHLLVAFGILGAVGVAGFSALPGLVALAPMLLIGASAALTWVVMQHRILTVRPGAAGTTKAVVSTIDSVALAAPIAIGAVADRWGLGTGIAACTILPVAFALVASYGIHLSRAARPYRDADAGGAEPEPERD